MCFPCYWCSLAQGIEQFTRLYGSICYNEDACEDVDDVDSTTMVSYRRSVFYPSSRGCVSLAIHFGCISYSYKDYFDMLYYAIRL